MGLAHAWEHEGSAVKVLIIGGLIWLAVEAAMSVTVDPASQAVYADVLMLVASLAPILIIMMVMSYVMKRRR